MPLAIRLATDGGHTEDLRLTVGRRRLPHGPQVRTASGTPIFPIVTGSQERHCYRSYTSARTHRPVAWLVPLQAGPCLRFPRATQTVRSLPLPTEGNAPVVHQGITVTLLPKLAFFTLWDCSAERTHSRWTRSLLPMILRCSCYLMRMRPLSRSASKSKHSRPSSPSILGAPAGTCTPGPPSRRVLGGHGPGPGQGTCRPGHLPRGGHRQPVQPRPAAGSRSNLPSSAAFRYSSSTSLM